MDIFKQKKNLIITIVFLVVLNLITLLLLWLGKPKHDIKRGSEGGNDRVRIQEMIKEELGFSNEQAEQFLVLREDQKEQKLKLDRELMLIKKEMFEEAMYGENIIISDSLLNLSLEKQSQLEKLAFEHFLKLKQICTPEQQKELFKHMHGLLGPPQPGGPPPEEFGDDIPPPQGERPNGPPPHGEHPPKRN